MSYVGPLEVFVTFFHELENENAFVLTGMEKKNGS